MNNTRRKELDRALDLLIEAKNIIESVRDDEQESLDNLPESIQEGEQGIKMSNCVDSLDDALYSVDDILEAVECAKD